MNYWVATVCVCVPCSVFRRKHTKNPANSEDSMQKTPANSWRIGENIMYRANKSLDARCFFHKNCLLRFTFCSRLSTMIWSAFHIDSIKLYTVLSCWQIFWSYREKIKNNPSLGKKNPSFFSWQQQHSTPIIFDFVQQMQNASSPPQPTRQRN